MNDPVPTDLIRTTFNAVADGYDCTALRFFAASAQRHAEAFDLRGSEQVLDLATGTGAIAIALARRLPTGRVLGVDFSSAMLARALAKADALHLENIQFVETDMRTPPRSAAPFDAAACGFGLFFVDDMVALAQKVAGLLKPGGTFIASGFTDDAFQPLLDVFVDRLRSYGVSTPPRGWLRMATEAQCIDLFRQGGFEDVSVEVADLGYYLRDAEEWWDFVWYAGLRGWLAPLNPQQLANFKRENLSDVQALATDAGIWLAAKVQYTRGRLAPR